MHEQFSERVDALHGIQLLGRVNVVKHFDDDYPQLSLIDHVDNLLFLNLAQFSFLPMTMNYST